jgi:hypothetical protein
MVETCQPYFLQLAKPWLPGVKQARAHSSVIFAAAWRECGGRLGDVQPAGSAAGPRRQLTPAFKKLEPGAVLLKEKSRRLHAHFPKCRHRPEPAAWSGDLCEEPVTFRGGGADVSCYGISSPLVAGMRRGARRRWWRG